ncbi:hypothetical protein [Streptomyces acidicola]|uniref:hypothetical protein n=1 Tax=Streptomyces acidicola TaxID=2596892 RepID=UPI00380A3999
MRIDVGDRRVFDDGVQAVITGATVGHWWAERPVGVDGTPPMLNVEPKFIPGSQSRRSRPGQG